MTSKYISSIIRTSIIRNLAYPNSHKQDCKLNDIHIVIELSVIKQASGEREVFSLVMKPNNCLRLRVLNWRTRPHLANRRACLSTSPYHPVFKIIKSLEGDRGMDRCHYAVPFKGISIRSTPEIVLSSKRN